MVAVGEASIDLTPPPVKDFAISTFGSSDKAALVTGILLLLAVFAAVIGVAAVRRFRYGVAGLAVFTAIGLAAALSRPTAGAADVLPSLVGGAAGLFAMWRLVQAAHEAAGERAALAGPAGTQDELGGPPALAQPGAGELGDPGTSWVPRRPAAPGTPPGGVHRAPPAGSGVSPAGRRQFLVTSSVAVAAAGASGLVGRVLAEHSSVSQARAAIKLPAPSSAPRRCPAEPTCTSPASARS